MKLVTSQQMRALDRAATQHHGIPSLMLMERAGAAVAATALEMAGRRKGVIAIFCGRGNNGGDGLVAARLLIEQGREVAVFLCARPQELSPDARANWERCAPLTTHIFEVTSFADLTPHHPVLAGAALIVDALVGTGLARAVDGLLAEVIVYLNALKRRALAVDIPSGLSADTGTVMGVAVRADRTITFGLPKLGLYGGDAATYAGGVSVIDIGIPREAIDDVRTPYHLIDDEMVRALFAARSPASHKGTHGHVAVVAGSGGKLGAGYLTAMAALRAGAGLVTYYLPAAAFEKFDARYPEIMCEAVPDKGRGHFHPEGVAALTNSLVGKNVMALGPALGTHDDTRQFERELLVAPHMPIVIDADGLNNLDPDTLHYRQIPMVLTPHPGEFARLTGVPVERQQRERLRLARELALRTHAHVVLKGHHTIVATREGDTYINPTGSAAMASAGMGDALTGVIAGFIAQGIAPDKAAIAGVYIHGMAGDMAATEIGDRGVIATDVIKRVPQALQMIVRENGP